MYKRQSGLHAVIPASPERGLHPGVIFTLRNREEGINVNQQNRLHPFYLIYMGADGDVITDHTQVKNILDLVRASCKGRSAPVEAAYKPFNEATDDGRDMHAYSDLLDRSIRTMIEHKADSDIESLFSQGGVTTALVDDIQGLDDFELISFLVIWGE